MSHCVDNLSIHMLYAYTIIIIFIVNFKTLFMIDFAVFKTSKVVLSRLFRPVIKGRLVAD